VNPVPRPVVIGAGWSGLACAVQLVQLGHRPIVLDAAPGAGGRARGLEHDLGGVRVRIDNGQHLLLGACRETLQTLRAVGIDSARAFARLPFALAYPDGWRLGVAPAPAPWHLALGLAAARRVSWAQRWSLARWMLRQRRAGWRVAHDAPAAELFAGESPDLVRRLWRPLCLAALNVELPQASARILLNVLRDSLGADAAALQILLPRTDLSTLFPDAAVRWLRERGAQVRLRTTVLALHPDEAGTACRVQLRDERLPAGPVVLAVPPQRAAALLGDVDARAAGLLRALHSAPICTTYLRYAPGTRLPRPFCLLPDAPVQGLHGQCVFDRGAFDLGLDGVLSVVVSGAGAHMDLPREALGRRVARQLAECFGLPDPRDHVTFREKEATLVPSPALERPGAELALPGLYLAGDAVESPYPSTIEGSVRSGRRVAQAIGAPSRVDADLRREMRLPSAG
jgi:squalene-associated FAD-dependent desaturase